MSRSSKPSKRASVRCLFIAIVVTLQACSTTSMPPSQVSPLVVASCPPLQPLTDDSFGATTSKMIEVAGQYNKCRAAAGVEP